MVGGTVEYLQMLFTIGLVVPGRAFIQIFDPGRGDLDLGIARGCILPTEPLIFPPHSCHVYCARHLKTLFWDLNLDHTSLMNKMTIAG